MSALHVHLLLPLGSITVSPHTLCHHKLYGLQNITIHLVLSQTLYGLAVSPHIKYLYKGFVWTIMYHHTSSIITNSCMDYTVSPHIQYHHKLLYGLYSITTHQVSSQSLCMDNPVLPQHTAPVTHHCV